jgi:2-methylcitrate dehydratase PrpD
LCALGNALAFASGTMQAHLEGKPTLAVQVAGAARSAVEAVDLALAGMAAPSASIDGPFGYMTLFEGGHRLADLLPELGLAQCVSELSWKPFPTGRAAHGALVALQSMMRENGLSAATLEEFTYRAPPLIARLVGRRPFLDMTASYARLCFAYLGAVALRHGTVGLEHFSDAFLSDKELHALAARIVVTPDGNPDPAAFVPATAIAKRHDGPPLMVKVERQFGSPGWPLSRAEHFAKADACLAFGGMSAAAAALSDIFDCFERVPDAAVAVAPAYG